jgi:hypothetical protein
MSKPDISNDETEDANSTEEKMVLRSATNSSKPRKTWREDGLDDDYEFEDSDDADIEYNYSRRNRTKNSQNRARTTKRHEKNQSSASYIPPYNTRSRGGSSQRVNRFKDVQSDDDLIDEDKSLSYRNSKLNQQTSSNNTNANRKRFRSQSDSKVTLSELEENELAAASLLGLAETALMMEKELRPALQTSKKLRLDENSMEPQLKKQSTGNSATIYSPMSLPTTATTSEKQNLPNGAAANMRRPPNMHLSPESEPLKSSFSQLPPHSISSTAGPHNHLPSLGENYDMGLFEQMRDQIMSPPQFPQFNNVVPPPHQIVTWAQRVYRRNSTHVAIAYYIFRMQKYSLLRSLRTAMNVDYTQHLLHPFSLDPTYEARLAKERSELQRRQQQMANTAILYANPTTGVAPLTTVPWW